MERLFILRFSEKEITTAHLHHKQNYIVCVCKTKEGASQIFTVNFVKGIHQQIKVKTKSVILNCVFHNKHPWLLIMTKQNVFIYDLQKQSLSKKLITSSKHLSNLALHSSGEHLLVSSLDKKVLWFDLD